MLSVSSPRRLLAVLAAAVLLSGCASAISQKHLERRFYAFEVRREAPARAPLAEALKVRRIEVAPSFAGRSLVYRTAPGVYESDYYNLFLVAPDEQLTQVARRWLESSGLFRHVAFAGGELAAGYALEGTVVSLFGDFSAGRPGKAVVEVQFFLLKDGPRGPEVRLNRTYRHEAPMEQDTAESLVRGYDTVLAAILTDLEQDVAKALVE